MQPELIIALKEVALEAIRIMGPAIIAAFAAYKAAEIQYKSKIEELVRTNDFHASKAIFDLYKEWHEGTAEGYQAITENLFTLSGMLISGEGEEQIEAYISKYVNVYVHKIPFQLRKALREFDVYKEKYPEDYEELKLAEKKYDSLKPITIENHADQIVELEFIYSTIANIVQLHIGEKMDEVFAQHTVNKASHMDKH